MIERARGHELCGACTQRVVAEQAGAKTEYTAALTAIDPNSSLDGLSARLAEMEARAGLEQAATESARGAVVRNLMSRYVEDGSLSEAEEEGVFTVAKALGLDELAIGRAIADLQSEVLIATLNAGRLDPLTSPQRIMMKRGELVYLQVRAELLKEVVHRETRGGFAGVSFQVAPGVRVKTGGFRGHSVVTGTSVVVDDTGILSVSSQRIVFTGSRRGLDVPYGKILSMNGFSDGIQLIIANRVNQPTFRVIGIESGGPLILAYVSAITQG